MLYSLIFLFVLRKKIRPLIKTRIDNGKKIHAAINNRMLSEKSFRKVAAVANKISEVRRNERNVL